MHGLKSNLFLAPAGLITAFKLMSFYIYNHLTNQLINQSTISDFRANPNNQPPNSQGCANCQCRIILRLKIGFFGSVFFSS